MLLPYVLFVFLYVGSNLLIYEFERWITSVCSPYVISLCEFSYYVFGQVPAVAMHLALWYVVFVYHQCDVCENSVAVCMLVGIVVWAKADSVSSVNCVQSAFL